MADHAINSSIEQLLQSHNGPVALTGASGEQYVAMSRKVYNAMLGIDADEEAATLAAVLRGIADVEAGRTHDVDEVFDSLES